MFPEGRILDFLIVGVIALIVVGPKDLPVLMRRVGQFVARMRAMAAEFRASFDEMARQSELDELRAEVEALRHARPLDPLTGADEARQVIDDIGESLREKPQPAPMSEAAIPSPAEPMLPTAVDLVRKPSRRRIAARGQTRDGSLSVAQDDTEIEASRAPLLEHLIELRRRLIVCAVAIGLAFVVCFAFSEQIYEFLLRPFHVATELMAAQHARGAHHGPFDLILALVGAQAPGRDVQHVSLIFTAPLEFFFTKVKLAVFSAVAVSFPILAFQLYRFVAPGLYRRERGAFLPFLLASPVLFIMGAALVYFVMLPFVLWFSLNQQVTGAGNISVQMLPKVSDYLSLVTTLLMAFGLCFQLPVVLSLMGLAGLLNAKMLRSGRRYAILGVFVVAAILTPPDPISMISSGLLPICLLYEISIWCVALIEGRRAREDAAPIA